LAEGLIVDGCGLEAIERQVSEHAAGQALLFNRLMPTQELAGAIEATTAEDFRDYGETVLSSGRRALATLGPKRAGEAAKAFDRALS